MPAQVWGRTSAYTELYGEESAATSVPGTKRCRTVRIDFLKHLREATQYAPLRSTCAEQHDERVPHQARTP
jgi:hypothetical protein